MFGTGCESVLGSWWLACLTPPEPANSYLTRVDALVSPSNSFFSSLLLLFIYYIRSSTMKDRSAGYPTRFDLIRRCIFISLHPNTDRDLSIINDNFFNLRHNIPQTLGHYFLDLLSIFLYPSFKNWKDALIF